MTRIVNQTGEVCNNEVDKDFNEYFRWSLQHTLRLYFLGIANDSFSNTCTNIQEGSPIEGQPLPHNEMACEPAMSTDSAGTDSHGSEQNNDNLSMPYTGVELREPLLSDEDTRHY